VSLRQRSIGVWFVAPAVVVLVVTTVYPLLSTIYLSFTGGSMLSGTSFVGWDNFAEAFGSPRVHQSLVATVYYVLGTTALTVPAAFLVALALERVGRRLARTATWLKAAIFLPVILSTVISAIVWVSVYHPFGGVLQLLPMPFGLDGVNWYQNEGLVIPALIIFTVWKRLGLFVVMFLAGIASIPKELLEAAEVDGARPWQRIRYVLIPMLRPVFLAAIVISTVFAFQSFAIAYTSTGGGPNGASRILPILIYEEGFRNFRQGYASTLALVMLVVITLISLIQMRVLKGRVDE
jgi:multiple sugar transport system permease protein